MVKSITALLIIKKGNVKKCFILDDRCFITQIASDLLLSHQNPDEAHGNLITAVVSKLDTVSFQGNSYLITEKARFLYIDYLFSLKMRNLESVLSELSTIYLFSLA